MTKLQAIIFDLDDTLYPEIQFVYSGFNTVANWVETQFGLDSELVYREFIGIFKNGDKSKVFNVWLKKNNLDLHLVKTFIKIYRAHQPAISLHSGMEDLLQTLCNDYLLGIVSDGYLDVQRKKIKSLEIEKYFMAITLSDKFGRKYWKPSIKPFEDVLDSLAVSSSKSVYVADNPKKDFYGPRQLGMKTIRLRMKDGVYKDLLPESEKYAPGHTVNSISQLKDLLETI